MLFSLAKCHIGSLIRNTKVLGDPISTMINIILCPSPKGSYSSPFHLISNKLFDDEGS